MELWKKEIKKSEYVKIKLPAVWDKAKLRAFLSLHANWHQSTVHKLFQEKLIFPKQEVFSNLINLLKKFDEP